MPASGALHLVVELDLEALALGPAGVHAQQHLGEVLGVDPTVLGVDLHDAVGVVVLAGEQAAQLEHVELLGDRRDAGLDLGLVGRVVDLARQFVQDLGILELAGELVVQVDVGLDVGVVGVDLLGTLGVVPEIGPADLGFELDQPVAALADLQVTGRLVETTANIAQVVGEVTHLPHLLQAAPWHILNFLPEPHGHGALRGVLSKASLTTVVGLLICAGAGDASGAPGRSPSATA